MVRIATNHLIVISICRNEPSINSFSFSALNLRVGQRFDVPFSPIPCLPPLPPPLPPSFLLAAPEERPPNPLAPLNEIELSEQRTELTKLEEKWRRVREDEEYNAARLLGWTKQAEMYNGRFAMFFLVVGLLTEYWTGVTFPGQIEVRRIEARDATHTHTQSPIMTNQLTSLPPLPQEMLRVGGFIELN